MFKTRFFPLDKYFLIEKKNTSYNRLLFVDKHFMRNIFIIEVREHLINFTT